MRSAAFSLLLLVAAAVPEPARARGGGGDSYLAPSRESSSESSSSGSSGASSWGGSYDRDSETGRGAASPDRDRRPHVLYPTRRAGSEDAVLATFLFLASLGALAFFLWLAAAATPRSVAALMGLLLRPLWKGREPVVGVSCAPLISRDPAFDRTAFLIHAQRVFCVVQAAWSRGAMDAAAALVSDGVVERFETLLAMQRLEGRLNEVADLSVEGAEAVSVLATDAADRVTVHFTARCRDVYRSPDGAVLSDRRDVFEEDWTFLRSASARGRRVPGPLEGVCPACGSEVKAGRAALCPRCRTWLNTGEHGWVLCEISQPGVWRLASRTAGWAFDGQEDAHPALLEDRAAVFFWWVLKALADGDASGLSGLTDPALHAALAQDARGPVWFGDCGVGEVTLTGSRRDAAFSYAEFEVLWSGVPRRRGGGKPGTATRQATRLALRRRSDAPASFRAGLRAAHCAGCGVPSEPGSPACAYCSRPRGEGGGDWVLAEFATRPWG